MRRALGVLFLAVGCMPEAARESVPASADAVPFEIIAVSARGVLESAPDEVSIVFSRPVHALEAPSGDASSVARLERATDHEPIRGSWSWFGSQTVAFRPQGGKLPNATEFVLTIPAGIEALDGARLPSSETIAFSTPRPRLEAADYGMDDSLPGPARPNVRLTFNVPIRAVDVERAVHFEGKRRGRPFSAPFKVDATDSGSGHDVARGFTSYVGSSLATIDELVVIAGGDLHAAEGPLLATKATRLDVSGAGPLKLAVSCTEVAGGCDPDRSAWVSLSKATSAERVRSHLETVPKVPVDLGDFDVTGFDLGEIFKLTARSKYRITLRAGLVMNDGETLDEDKVVEVAMGDRQPDLSWAALRGETVVEAARGSLSFGVSTVNLPRFEVVTAPLDESALRAFLSARPRGFESVRALSGATSREIPSCTGANTTCAARVDIPASMRPESGFGAFALAVRSPIGSVDLADRPHLISVTDIGVTTKWGPYGGLAWLTHLSSGTPIAGATVSVSAIDPPADSQGPKKAPPFVGTSDADGIVLLPRELVSTIGTSDAVLVARAGSDWTYARLPRPRPADPIGLLFTERLLYRPGDTVHVKGYLRIPAATGGLESSAGQPVDVELVDTRGRRLHHERAVLDAFGSFSTAIELPRSVTMTARVRMRLAASGESDPWIEGQDRFLVEDHRSVEFKVEASTDRATYTRGDVAKLAVDANYLFGAPMHDVPAGYAMTREATRFTPMGWERFSFGDDLFGSRSPVVPAAGSALLGAGGRAVANVPLDLIDQRGAENVGFEAYVEDVGQGFRVGGRSKPALVHPGEFYLGLRWSDEHPRIVGDALAVETVATTPDGAAWHAVPVHLAFYETVGDGRVPLGACDATTGAKPKSCAFVAREPGTYAVLASATDDHGHELYASVEQFVPRQRRDASVNPTRPVPTKTPTFEERCRRGDREEAYLFTDENAYAPGASATVCLGAPGGRALLTLEREGVLRHEVLSLPVPRGRLALPVTDVLEPDARVVVHSVTPRRGRLATPEDGGNRPRAAEAGAEIAVQRPETRLAVSMNPAPPHRERSDGKYHPGDEVDVAFTVADGRGQGTVAQVTFFAVDEGTNLLVPYRRPEPSVFWRSRGSRVRSGDTRDAIYWEPLPHSQHVRTPVIRQGATVVGDDRAPLGRRGLVPTASFLPAIVTDAGGHATAHFKLPDNTTTWKLYAVAAAGTESFGVAESQLVASQAVLVRSALPRFLRAGDRLVAGAIVDTSDDTPRALDVAFSAAGAATADVHASLELPPRGHAAVGFPLQVDHLGPAKLGFVVRGAGPSTLDALEVVVPVSAPSGLETTAFAGQTKRRANETLSLRDRRLDTGGLDYRIATTPMVALAEGFEQLLQYPYGCTEQIVSRLVPFIALRRLAATYGLSLPPDVEAPARAAIDELLSHQKPDGAFGVWATSPTTSPWLTAYAAWGLSVAREAGYVLPEDVIDRALSRVEDDGRDKPAIEDLALAEDVRASFGAPRIDRLKALAARAPISPEAQGLLVHALARVDGAAARSLLDAIPVHVSGAAATVSPGETPGTFASSTSRATAIALRAFAAVDAHHPLVSLLTRGLLALRENGRWPSTQDTAWSLLALRDAAGPDEKTSRDFAVRLGERVVDAATLPASSLAAHAGFLPMSALASAPAVSFESPGGGLLYYEGYLRTAPKEPPTSPFSRGFSVDRSYQVVTAEASGGRTSVRVGDYLRIDLYVTSVTPRDQVVVEDPLPAGVEPISGQYATETRDSRASSIPEAVFQHREFRDDRVLTFVDHLAAGTSHFAYRVRATTPGTFQVPAARAECMYAPDLFGRTGASVLTVEPPSLR